MKAEARSTTPQARHKKGKGFPMLRAAKQRLGQLGGHCERRDALPMLPAAQQRLGQLGGHSEWRDAYHEL